MPWCACGEAANTSVAAPTHAIPDSVLELAKICPSNIFDDRRVRVRILADARHGFVDALQELVAEGRLLRIVPFDGLLDVMGGQRREVNWIWMLCQKGAAGERRGN